MLMLVVACGAARFHMHSLDLRVAMQPCDDVGLLRLWRVIARGEHMQFRATSFSFFQVGEAFLPTRSFIASSGSF